MLPCALQPLEIACEQSYGAKSPQHRVLPGGRGCGAAHTCSYGEGAAQEVPRPNEANRPGRDQALQGGPGTTSTTAIPSLLLQSSHMDSTGAEPRAVSLQQQEGD